jgi:DtxR family Mn-dependent transcriptional regulator
MEKLSAAMENYLKTIYFMCRYDTTTRVSDIAARMKLSKASVCRATDLLSNKGLVRKDKCHGISLTADGLKEAELITSKYNIIQTFLNDVLEIDPSVANQDACNFEHDISPESLQSMRHYSENYRADAKNKEESVLHRIDL